MMATPNSASEGQSDTLAPLSASDFNSSSFLTDVLGLSPSSNTSKGSGCNAGSAAVVKTYQCGEFKYPDVSSPLNKILSKSRSNRFGGGSVHGSGGLESGSGSYPSFQQFRESDRSVYSTPDSGLYQQFRGNYEIGDNAVEDFQAHTRSPQTFSSQPAVGFTSGGGVGEVTRSRSPQSDGGYGTSFDSNESRGQVMRRDIDIDGLSELLRNISMNTSAMKIPGSPIGTSSAVGPSSNSKVMYGDGLNVLTPSNGGGMTGGLPDFDPAVSHYQQQAAASIQHHHPHAHQQQEQAFLQNLQNLHSYMSSGGSGGGRHMGSNVDSSFSGAQHYNPNQFSYRGSYLGGGGGGALSPNTSTLETAARIHRTSAGWERQFTGGPGRAYHAAVNDATCTWSGPLPPRCQNNSPLSCKIFLGGVPWDISDQILFAAFKPFGNIRIEWPHKDNSSTPKGYLYIIFEHEKQVRSLLQACTHDYAHGGSWYYKISSRRMKNKEVQVIPWIIADSSFVRCPSQQLDPQKTVFVGALHGMLNAEGLCNIFNDLFGGVIYASVDTDKYNYPIGSGRVTFNNAKSCMKAVSAAFIEIRTQKFSKKVQVDPYLEDALCSSCGLRQGPYFCRDLNCFKYFCRTCWDIQHAIELLSHHQPLMRNSRPSNNQNLNKSYGGLPEYFGGNMRSLQTRFDSNYE